MHERTEGKIFRVERAVEVHVGGDVQTLVPEGALLEIEALHRTVAPYVKVGRYVGGARASGEYMLLRTLAQWLQNGTLVEVPK